MAKPKKKYLAKIESFLKETLLEMKRVNWLSRKQTVNYTIIVIAMSLALAIYLGFLDYVFISILMKLRFGF